MPVKMVVPADKGRAVAVEIKQSYNRKEQEQVDEGCYKVNKMNQELIVKNFNNKMKKALSRMEIKKLHDHDIKTNI